MIRDRADFGKGSPAIPMTYDEVADKFRECAAYSRWPKSKTEQVVAMVRGLEEVRDVRALTALLSRPAAGSSGKQAVSTPRKAAAARTPARRSNASRAGVARKRSR